MMISPGDSPRGGRWLDGKPLHREVTALDSAPRAGLTMCAMEMAQPRIETRSEVPYVSITVRVTMDEVGTEVPPITDEVFDWLATRGLEAAGPPFWKYNVVDMEHHLEIEVGVPVTDAATGDERVQSAVLPAGRYVMADHVGHPATLEAATGTLLEWASQRDLTWDTTGSGPEERWGARLEIYHTDPAEEPDMAKWQTTLAFRLAN